KEFQTDRDNYAKRIGELENALRAVENKKATEVIEPIVKENERMAKLVKDLQTSLKDANEKLTAMVTKYEARTEEKPLDPTPRGEIVRVQLNPRKATINLGRVHGLKPQVTFSVHGIAANGKPKVASKANVEVVTVGENTSEVLVTAIFHP